MSMKKIFKLLTFTLLLIIVHSACSKNFKDEGNITDDNTDEKVDASEIDMSNIDFNNIENLFAQPLPVIQKCMEGNWKLIYTYGGIMGETIVDKYDSYMQITSERIKIGNNTAGILTDSPITWANLENFWDFPIVHFIAYNIIDEAPSIMYAEHIFPCSIKNDTLVVWDLYRDGYFKYYHKIKK